jgi:septum formation topological specificity factor MinE
MKKQGKGHSNADAKLKLPESCLTAQERRDSLQERVETLDLEILRVQLEYVSASNDERRITLGKAKLMRQAERTELWKQIRKESQYNNITHPFLHLLSSFIFITSDTALAQEEQQERNATSEPLPIPSSDPLIICCFPNLIPSLGQDSLPSLFSSCFSQSWRSLFSLSSPPPPSSLSEEQSNLLLGKKGT